MAALMIDALDPPPGVPRGAVGGQAASELAALLRYRCVRFYGPDWRPAAARDVPLVETPPNGHTTTCTCPDKRDGAPACKPEYSLADLQEIQGVLDRLPPRTGQPRDSWTETEGPGA